MRLGAIWFLATTLLFVAGCQDGLLGVDGTTPIVECECQVADQTDDDRARLEAQSSEVGQCDPLQQTGCEMGEQCAFVRFANTARWQVACIGGGVQPIVGSPTAY